MSIPLQELARTIKLLQNKQRRLLDSRLGEIGITLVQWDALRAIGRNPGASSHDLADYTFQTDQSFGALAMRLLEKGLITRSPGKGRVIGHLLTAEGEAALSRSSAVADSALQEEFGCLSNSERRTLLGLMKRLVEQNPAVTDP